MANNQPIYYTFTTISNGIERRLINKASAIFEGKSVEKTALWDTGASCTCISSDVVKDLDLVPTGKMQINTPNAQSEVNTYLIDIKLPNNVLIKNICVCDSDIEKQNIGLLIGMDIISLGDFAVSNFNKKTTFSFRTPSKQVTDYVKQSRFEEVIGPTHGKGKRKHKR